MLPTTTSAAITNNIDNSDKSLDDPTTRHPPLPHHRDKGTNTKTPRPRHEPNRPTETRATPPDTKQHPGARRRQTTTRLPPRSNDVDPEPPTRPTVRVSRPTGKVSGQNCSGTQDAEHDFPPGFPPTAVKRISWNDDDPRTDLASSNTSRNDSFRREDIAIERTAKRITRKDTIDRSIIGEFPTGRAIYLPSNVDDILPSQIVGPNDFFEPGPHFISQIRTIMRSLPPTPLAPPFRFGTTPPDLAHNAGLLEAAQFDLAQLLPRHQRSTLGFGSEFRPVPDLEPLLGRHPLFPFVSGILSNGMDYEFHEGKELSESERLIEMAGQLQRGNHKSVTDALETVQTLLTKDVTHGFTLPLPASCAPQIKGAMIQPLGVVKQTSMNKDGDRVEKCRLTQDLSFSLDVRNHSVNGRVNLNRYPEMIYGWCMPRILHLVSALRDEHPDTPIFICKYDYSDAYRRVAHSPRAAAQTIAVLGDVAYVSLRLTFGGSPNPPTWCAVSELVTDLANEIAWCSEWDPTTTHSSMMPPHATPPPKRVDPSVPFTQSRPMAVRVPSITTGRVDVFVDDVIHVFPDIPGALARLPHVVPLAMELTSRTHAGPEEPIPRRPILSPEKLAAEGAPAEIQQVLGWTIDTRRLTVSLPKDKFTMWVNDVRRIQKARRVSTELLATIEGRLNHTASIIPMARHFLTRLRKLKMTTLSAARPYTKIPDEVMADLQLWEKLLTTAHKGVSINLLTTRRPDIIGWSDACPFGMGGYNTAGRAWRLLIDPKSPIFGESRVNNALEYLAMTVNAIVSCRDVPDQPSPCVLALGDNTSAIGWLYRSSRLHQPHHAVHLQIARHLANEMIQNDCCLYSQHIPGARNIIADLLSYDGQGRDKPHPIAHDQPDDATLTRRFHASPHYSSQITSNFRISPLPPDIDSWLRRTLQTLESYASVELSSPSSPPTEHGGDGAATVVNSETPMTPHWTDYQHPHDNLSQKPLPNASAMPFGTQTATHSLIASVRERYYRGLSDKPSASWQRRVGGVDGRAPSTTRRHPMPSFPISLNSSSRFPNGILRRRSNAQ
jgi:hypothetical protein